MRTALILAVALAFASPLAGAQGPGMMGDGMRGQGMMGQGMGPGMGAQQGGMLAALNLSDAQREKVLAIQEEHRKKNWAAMGEVRAEQQKKVDELRRQMLKSRIEAHNQIAALLTPEQRKELRQRAPGWMMEGSE